jgi:queuine tRNA-ribosyltransferase catalytic subunit
MHLARDAIIADAFPAFLKVFFLKLFKIKSNYPAWAVGALKGVGVDLLED